MKWGILPLLIVLVAPAAGAPAGRQDGPDPKPVPRGIAWLLKAQNRDGSWGLDARSPTEISCTVVAALALMAGGNTERGGPDPASVQAVRKAVEFILLRARKMRGNIAGGETTLVQHKLGQHVHTFFSTVFLTQAYGMRGTWVRPEDLEELKDHISNLTMQIVKTQESDGSWHKETFGSLKATCMAWLALRSAASAGLDVESASVERTIKFIKAQYNPVTRLFDKMTGHGNYQTIYATASCLRVLYGMGEGNSAEARGATEAFMTFVKTGQMGAAYLTVEGEDYMSAALVSQALLIEQDQRWTAWQPWITNELVKRQAPDGSWTTTACISGRTFATSCALLALQTPYRLLPIMEQ